MVQTQIQIIAGPKAQPKHKLRGPPNPKETLVAMTNDYQPSSVAKHQSPLHQVHHLLQ